MEENIARLKGPAARLLLILLLARSRGETKIKAGELREWAGLPNSRIFAEAREQLERFGFATLEKRGQYYVVNAFALNGSVIAESVSLPNGMYVSSYRKIHGTDAIPSEPDEPELFLPRPGMKKVPRGPKQENGPMSPNFLEELLENGPIGTNPKKNGPIGTNSKMDSQVQIQENGPLSPKSRCVEVDRMDDSGDLARANTPAQIRRREQVAVVQDVWGKFFPDQPPLIAENAKRLLSGLEQSAEAVYDLLEYVKSRNPGSPLTYALATARNKSAPKPEAPTSPALVPGPVSSPEPDPVEQKHVESAAAKQRIKNWKRFHPHEPVPTEFYE